MATVCEALNEISKYLGGEMPFREFEEWATGNAFEPYGKQDSPEKLLAFRIIDAIDLCADDPTDEGLRAEMRFIVDSYQQPGQLKPPTIQPGIATPLEPAAFLR